MRWTTRIVESGRCSSGWLLAAMVCLLVACATPGSPSSDSTDANGAAETRETLQLRVWADTHYRQEHDAWREHIRQQIELLNDILSEELDVRVTVADARGWTPQTGPDDLDRLLDELRESDRGEEVDLVIGLTAAMPFEERSQRRLGYSTLLGKHFLVRGVDPTSDMAQLSAEFPDASDDELEREAQMRAAHRERTTILHELGHVLGAVHTRSDKWVMSPTYRRRQHRFSPENRRILRRSSTLLLESENHDAWQRAVSREVGPWIDAAQRDVFIPEDAAQVHQHMLALLEPDSLTSNEARIFNEGQAAARSGDFERALEIMQPLLESRPDHPMVIGAQCQFRVPLGMKDERTIRACARAMQAHPDDPVPALFLAQLHVGNGQSRPALAILIQAENRLAASDDNDARDYFLLAVLYQRIGAISRAEDAARRARGHDRADNILAWARKLRRTWGLARGSIPSRAEFAVAEKLRNFDGHLNTDQFGPAARIARQLDDEFPSSTITDVAYCRLLTARGDIEEAVSHCRNAVARDDSAAMAHYVIGVWETTKRNHRAANDHLSKAVSLTPSVRGFWHALASLYLQSDSDDAYRSIARDYYDRFGETLPE